MGPIVVVVLLDGDGLGQVPRAVDVAAPENRQVVGEQLHRDHRQHGLEGVDGVWNLNDLKMKEIDSLFRITFKRPLNLNDLKFK